MRHHGLPPRSVEEMAERLRLLGDITDSELCGPMAKFLAELEESGRAVRIELGVTREQKRWVLAEEADRYRAAFPGPSTGDQEMASGDRPPVPRCRLMHSSASVDLSARYPIEPVEAAELLEQWCERGEVVRFGERGPAGDSQWADARELDRRCARDRRGSTPRGVRRVLPEVFADCLLRRQHVHPASRCDGSTAGVESVLEQLQGYAAPALLWESELLPRRVKDYRPALLDEVLSRGNPPPAAEGAAGEETGRLCSRVPGSFDYGDARSGSTGTGASDSRITGPARGELRGRPGEAVGNRNVERGSRFGVCCGAGW